MSQENIFGRLVAGSWTVKGDLYGNRRTNMNTYVTRFQVIQSCRFDNKSR